MQKSDISTWYDEFKAFDIIVSGKTYAQALLAHKNDKVRILKYDFKCQYSVNASTSLESEKHSPDCSKASKPKQVLQGMGTKLNCYRSWQCGRGANYKTTLSGPIFAFQQVSNASTFG